MTRHTQRRIHVSTPWGYSDLISVDAGIDRLIQLIHDCGFVTCMSCENWVNTNRVWVVFPLDDIGRDFRELLAPIASKVNVEVGEAWPGTYSVAFSLTDLPFVEKALASEERRQADLNQSAGNRDRNTAAPHRLDDGLDPFHREVRRQRLERERARR